MERTARKDPSCSLRIADDIESHRSGNVKSLVGASNFVILNRVMIRRCAMVWGDKHLAKVGMGIDR